jgi:hypothetical protein
MTNITGNTEAQIRDDIWQVFMVVGKGYRCFLQAPPHQEIIYCDQAPEGEAPFFDSIWHDVIRDVLISKNNLLKAVTDELPNGASERYRLTEMGQTLFDEIKGLSSERSKSAFFSKIQL